MKDHLITSFLMSLLAIVIIIFAKWPIAFYWLTGVFLVVMITFALINLYMLILEIVKEKRKS